MSTYIKQISVFIENRPGRLADITRVLAAGEIDIRALSLADTTNFGILRLIINDPDKGEKLLKENGFTVSVTKVIAMKLPDSPGGLSNVLEVIGSVGVSIEYAYAFFHRKENEVCVILRVDDGDKAREALIKSNYHMIDPEEIYSL